MKRILIIGNSPLPNEETKSRPAAGLRTYQFLKPLIHAPGVGITSRDHAFSASNHPKNKVVFVSIAMPECYDGEPEEKHVRTSELYEHIQISKDNVDLFRRVQEIHDELHPDAIITVNTFPSFVASQLESRAPMWCDLNGWVMAEGQAQAGRQNNNDFLAHYYEMERSILLRADKFSTVSDAQRNAVYGELAMVGRLIGESFGYEFVSAVPNGTEMFETDHINEDDDVVEKKVREIFKGVPKNAFVLLWMGGYNTWVDEVTLFKGVEAAMEKCPKLYFVSTGGAINGLDDSVFGKFKKMVDGSKFAKRFVFLGWVDTADIPLIYARSDVGLNVDRKCAETLMGARNRINEMMKFGVPVISSLGSEIAGAVRDTEAGAVFESGKHEEFASIIEKFYKDKEDRHGYKLKQYGLNGIEYIKEKCNYDVLSRDLMRWLENPRPAPDRGIEAVFSKRNTLKTAWRYFKKNGFGKFVKKTMQRLRK